MSAREEVVAATERRTRALVERDADALLALHHPDLRFTTPRADVGRAFIAGNTQGDLVWRGQQMTEVDVVTSGDTAVLTALVRDQLERGGKPVEHAARLTLTWIREDGAWRVLAGHGTLSPD